jgi:hypothetical protein
MAIDDAGYGDVVVDDYGATDIQGGVDLGIDRLPKRLPTRWLVRTAIGQILVGLGLPLLLHGLGCRWAGRSLPLVDVDLK